MSHTDPERVQARAASPTAEERVVGIDDPERQAEVILEESDVRQENRDEAPGSYVEHRTSDEATPPVE